ncbi:unnamed protein product, partial [Ectocarpus sp. 4 AP-2014]
HQATIGSPEGRPVLSRSVSSQLPSCRRETIHPTPDRSDGARSRRHPRTRRRTSRDSAWACHRTPPRQCHPMPPIPSLGLRTPPRRCHPKHPTPRRCHPTPPTPRRCHPKPPTPRRCYPKPPTPKPQKRESVP